MTPLQKAFDALAIAAAEIEAEPRAHLLPHLAEVDRLIRATVPPWQSITRSDRIRAHRMRENARSWVYIGTVLGYPWQTVRRAVRDHNGYGP